MTKKKSKKKEKTKGKSILLVVLIIMIVIALLAGGYFIYQNKKLKEPIEKPWGQTYYKYLLENGKKEKIKVPSKAKNKKLSFYEIDEVNDPVMVIDYSVDDETYSNIYFIEDEKVELVTFSTPNTIEFLYNIPLKKYDYYTLVKNEKESRYKSVGEQIKERINEIKKAKGADSLDLESENIACTQSDSSESAGVNCQEQNSSEYIFNDESIEKVTDVNGKELEINKFDETFVKPDIKNTSINYNTDLSEKDLKETITKEVQVYKTKDKVVTEKILDKVNEKAKKTQKTREEIEKAKEEILKKEAEEKAKKEAEEKERLEREGITVGTARLKYGRYEWNLSDLNMSGKETYILKSDKTCTYTDSDGKTTNCTFSVGTSTDGQDASSASVKPAIIINHGSYKSSFFPTSTGFRDTDMQDFKYVGAN